jgi:uncharacterized protein (DUF2126 family)
MLDGRHTGTGGGNHFVLGGAAPPTARSCAGPICCEPARLLAQPSVAVVPVLGHVHRPDQPGAARRRGAQRQLYELEIAFWSAACPPPATRAPPAVAGRPPVAQSAGRRHRQHAPRRVLHRQAVLARRRRPAGSACSSCARFEMPPHARMSLAQQLLLRALVARFWREPYARPLVRWGTELHDRFMLPHFVWQDFRTCSPSCARAGYAVRPGVVRAALRVPLPALRRVVARAAASSSSCARRSSRGTCWARRRGRRHRALRRFVGRAAAGEGKVTTA